MATNLDNRNLTPQQTHWIPLADLMTGLMMVFLLVAIAFMVKVEAAAQRIKQVAILYEQSRTELYKDLKKEFSQDLPKWGAELHRNLTIRFKEPDVLFARGSSELKLRFKTILDDFFPRYVKILYSDKYRKLIREIRIEGHTSSIWLNLPPDQAYFENMRLSQDRTRSTLQYVLGLPAIRDHLPWLRAHITANGLSSSQPIRRADGSEDYDRSQRVEFRVRTDAEARIARIIEVEK
jgi:outer membrane protein OmpA-like peptidoglycan-associated protein